MNTNEARIYQRIGEFVVSFQWLEHRLREIGWLILDPGRRVWPPTKLRREGGDALFGKVQKLFLGALPACRLGPDLESEYRTQFAESAERFATIRRARNRILHSAFVELKAGGEVLTLVRANPRVETDPETGETLFDEEVLSEDSFERELAAMAELAYFLNRC